MKLTNTLKHALVSISVLIVAVVLQKLVNLIPNTQFQIIYLVGLGLLVRSLYWEYQQYVEHGCKPFYWKFRLLDTVCDILAGNAPYWIGAWLLGVL